MNEAVKTNLVPMVAQEFAPQLRVRELEGQLEVGVKGDWTVHTIHLIENDLNGLLEVIKTKNIAPEDVSIHINHLNDLDSAGAYMLCEIIKAGQDDLVVNEETVFGEHPFARDFLKQMERFVEGGIEIPKPVDAVAKFKQHVVDGIDDFFRESVETLSFVGQTVSSLVLAFTNPKRVRWLPTISVAESAGLDAIPIVMMLTFFIGAVVAFMGAQTLEAFGGTVFTVDLVGISVLREFAVIITAIILAGRSDSAFTAQIGSMKMTQEIDAMSIIGLDPMEMLVIPRVLALLIMTPIMVFFAMIAGLVGGAFVSVLTLDISFTLYLNRLQEYVGDKHFWVGMSKAPVFAFIIAIIGCRQGLEVENDVISLGKHTTAAVVQAIFMVILVDAIFALIYNELEI
ncbi:MAG: hypothetical protein FD163_948 [Hyphomonadaceae bacterium]|nr:MAG: hypothetical protein FD163_948 [Hyphomonadaceae bacterium]